MIDLNVPETLSQFISDENWLAAFIVGIPVSVFLFRILYGLITELKERKINDFKKALEIDGLSKETRLTIQESLNQAYFYRATGITASPYLRCKICDFLQFTDKNISLFSIWRCSEYITLIDGKVTVKFERLDKIDYGWQILSILVTGVTSLVAIVFLMTIWNVEVEGKLILSLEIGVLLGITAHSVWKIFSFRFARDKLAAEFERFESSTEEVLVSDPNSVADPLTIKAVG